MREHGKYMRKYGENLKKIVSEYMGEYEELYERTR